MDPPYESDKRETNTYHIMALYAVESVIGDTSVLRVRLWKLDELLLGRPDADASLVGLMCCLMKLCEGSFISTWTTLGWRNCPRPTALTAVGTTPETTPGSGLGARVAPSMRPLLLLIDRTRARAPRTT